MHIKFGGPQGHDPAGLCFIQALNFTTIRNSLFCDFDYDYDYKISLYEIYIRVTSPIVADIVCLAGMQIFLHELDKTFIHNEMLLQIKP